ncbi:N-acetylglucosamine-6-phosphate deacetylase [Corynebacterium choanae]|uniref:N-acetylglucosamine-6-phosphate deacetylase n=1 Tax=Corynebacterium choanae TaxID=1862358 RepID=A0A3G6J5I5_9CORY|nr:N-acetylglucosamine-6-phosphate deacetylase [Corynebacterium choanae]AZA13307.1 N-acetylglucosamine-6-phosphate deacetylase [Corynebacterium choanae]
MTSLTCLNALVYDGSGNTPLSNAAVRVSDGVITHVGSTSEATHWPASTTTIDAHGAPLCPGYIDIHHHGGGGMAYDDGPAAIDHIMAAHLAHGTTRCVMSFVTDDFATMTKRIAAAAQIVRTNPHLLGIHPEGPFLDPGHKGAHPLQELKDPLPEYLHQLIDAAAGTMVQITLAPEKTGGMEAVTTLRSHGIVPAVGHTTCSYEQANEAFARGARILTHAFNAMNGIHHRAPGPVIAALRDQRVFLEVINDTIHVHPEVVATLFAEAPQRVVLVTDAMSATCNPDGDYMLGQLAVTVTDGVARLQEGGSLAGSTLTMDCAVANAITKVHVDPAVAIAAATSHPAQAIGMDDQYGYLRPGYPGDLLLLDPETFLPTMIYTDDTQITPAAAR